MYTPSLEEVKSYAPDYKTVPISRVIYSDMCTPIQVLQILKSVSCHCYMLESLEDTDKWGRYTFLGYDPKLEITCTDSVVRIRTGTELVIKDASPAQYIRQIIEENKSPRIEELPTFTGGLVGYFSYEIGRAHV